MSIDRLAVRLLAVGGAAILVSCASTPAINADSDVDYAKIAQIERAARAYGTQIIWINLPTKRSEATKQ
jgi:DhnA family fructose-bisphosphate aldolase class Ia